MSVPHLQLSCALYDNSNSHIVIYSQILALFRTMTNHGVDSFAMRGCILGSLAMQQLGEGQCCAW